MDEVVDLLPLPADAESMHETLEKGSMVILRSEAHFLYILKKDSSFYMFSHTPGQQEGGRKAFPDDEKGRAILKNLLDVAGSAYKAEFDDKMDIRGVMVAAEEGILSMFPLTDEQGGAEVDFGIPG